MGKEVKKKKRKKKPWLELKSVMNCEHIEYVDCPRCGLEFECTHVEGDVECTEEDCPIRKSKRK